MSTANSKRWSAKLAALDANLLVALDALLQESSVTAAAKRSGITQSAMSQTLARLRHQFDDPILVKVGRSMEPTPFGMRIKARLHRAMSELEAVITERPVFTPESASVRYVLAMVDYLALVILPSLARSVRERAPGIDFAVHSLDATSISPKLQEGLVHLYVGVAGETERALETQSLFSERLRVLVRMGHPLARGEMDVARFAAASHVLVSPRRESSSIVARALEEAGCERRVAIEVPYFSLIPQMLRQSDLIAIIPERLAELFADQHPVEILEPPLALPEIRICMAWHPTYGTDPAQVWLRDQVASVSGQL